MTRTYLRPRGLLVGGDARAAVAAGRAGRLGGHAALAFTSMEVITRSAAGAVERQLVPFSDDHPGIAAIVRPRPDLGGLDLSRPRFMGIVNVTPDSFSDGGDHDTPDAAIAHGRRLLAVGADLLDVGGESTRPGAAPVDVDRELRRVVPVITELARQAIVSVDTRKAAVIRAAVAVGASIVNDVSALTFDPGAAAACVETRAPVILMHTSADPTVMQQHTTYDDVLLDVYDALAARIDAAVAAGIPRSRLAIDPGIGFGKTFAQNVALIEGLPLLHALGLPVVVGLSRKAFVGALTGAAAPKDRDPGSIGGALRAALGGAHVLRVHDVRGTRAAWAVFAAEPDAAQ